MAYVTKGFLWNPVFLPHINLKKKMRLWDLQGNLSE